MRNDQSNDINVIRAKMDAAMGKLMHEYVMLLVRCGCKQITLY